MTSALGYFIITLQINPQNKLSHSILKTTIRGHVLSMKPNLNLSIQNFFKAAAKILCVAALSLPAVADTIYFDNFTTPGSNKGGPYTSSIDGTATTTGGGTWLAGVEAGGWGQTGDGRATPTSSNFLAFTPDSGRIYTVQATIDTTPLGGADPGGTNSWFALGFTSSQHNWNGVDGGTIDTGHLVQHPTNNYALLAIYAMFLSWPGFPHLFI